VLLLADLSAPDPLNTSQTTRPARLASKTWQTIEAAARRLSGLYGFRQIRVPIFELTELFAQSILTNSLI
jgi:histidyl-tRNA synthetase